MRYGFRLACQVQTLTAEVRHVDLSIRTGSAPHIRNAFRIRGRVQGVGFRPYLYRLATELGLSGFAGNDSDGVFVEVQGPAEAVTSFTRRLPAELPPLASITDLETAQLPVRLETGFTIQHSRSGETQEAEITPDAATCPDCQRELFDPRDRRHRYPFINCTNCGPRYSIVRSVPYDRPNTTMARFIMCPACQAEYDDPGDRRFHAQPNACPVCGPRVWLTDASGNPVSADAIAACAQQIRLGRIVAIKGIGGFHLACDATSDYAVQRLRMRKGREAKPFAIMAGSTSAAEELAYIDAAGAAAILEVERPIVLAPKRAQPHIADAVAPASDCFGIMLPYTPLHHLLFAEGLGPLVMTSGNPSEEPLCSDNKEALERLANIADYFLLHDRDIERRVDDSVVMIAKLWQRDTLGQPVSVSRAVPIRRARGFAPSSIPIETPARRPILAVGGELKSTVCILAGKRAVLSEHLGDLSNPAALRNFMGTVERLKNVLRTEPALVVHDLHPDYASTHYAKHLRLPLQAVQHHHAHVVSCMADNGITGRLIGLACDGTGYGTDGAIWGCELLSCDESSFERLGHLGYFPLLGGDAAAHETWRPAAGLLSQVFGEGWAEASAAFQRVPEDALKTAQQKLAVERLSGSRASRPPRTSSLGRLFDGVAFLLGVCDSNRYEAEAAMSLEALARECGTQEVLNFRLHSVGREPTQFDVEPMLRELIERHAAGGDAAILARAFHETLAAMLARAAIGAASATGLSRIAISGGCFANRLLLERITDRLATGGLEVFVHNRVPTGDGGIALGQAVAAAARMASVES